MTTASTPRPDGPPPGAAGGRRSSLTARFLRAVGREVGAEALTPAALARAVAEVLPVDAAGLSTLMGVLRVPLGSSNDLAATAEELQTTLGEGPCLDAAEAQDVVVIDADELGARWPLYAEQLTGRTPYRSVAALPLRIPGGGIFAALDLYTSDPQLSASLDLVEIDRDLAAPVAALLSACLAQLHDVKVPEARPGWYQTAAGRRHDVWVAIGMVMGNRPTRPGDALSLLRARAYSEDRSLDDIAEDIVTRRAPVTDVAADPGPDETPPS